MNIVVDERNVGLYSFAYNSYTLTLKAQFEGDSATYLPLLDSDGWKRLEKISACSILMRVYLVSKFANQKFNE